MERQPLWDGTELEKIDSNSWRNWFRSTSGNLLWAVGRSDKADSSVSIIANNPPVFEIDDCPVDYGETAITSTKILINHERTIWTSYNPDGERSREES
jgi:hypothetical protein